MHYPALQPDEGYNCTNSGDPIIHGRDKEQVFAEAIILQVLSVTPVPICPPPESHYMMERRGTQAQSENCSGSPFFVDFRPGY